MKTNFNITLQTVENYPLEFQDGSFKNNLLTCWIENIQNNSLIFETSIANPINWKIYNTDWFIHGDYSNTERLEGVFLDISRFEYLRFSSSEIPVIHETSFLVLEASGVIILNPPPIFIPCPGIILLYLSIFSFLKRTRHKIGFD